MIRIEQEGILEAVESSNQPVFLEPKPPEGCGGSVEHYYHFVFDLMLPLYCLTRKTNSDAIFVIKEPGLFTDRIQQLFPRNVKIEREVTDSNHIRRFRMTGMNPKGVHIKPKLLESFKKYVFDTFEIEQSKKANRILLIERIFPKSFFETNSEIKGGGANRRSILNHDELESAIKSAINKNYEIHNLRLEDVLFEDQLCYFDQAQLVIAQHGAGLANTIWMKSRSNVIELSSDWNLRHFRIISDRKRHRYFWEKIAGSHANIDVDAFMDSILSKSHLKKFFN